MTLHEILLTALKGFSLAYILSILAIALLRMLFFTVRLYDDAVGRMTEWYFEVYVEKKEKRK